MNLNLIQTFVEVVRANGFSAAAKRTGMPRSTVSLQVKALEDNLGVRLLKRSTRSISLTEDGDALYKQTSGTMDDLSRTVESLRNKNGELRGLIRVTAPADFPTPLLAKVVSEFNHDHPGVRFQIDLTNDPRNLVDDNIDVALRLGFSNALESIEKRLLEVEWEFVVGNQWLEQNGLPNSLSEISEFISPVASLRRFLEVNILAGKALPEAKIEVDNHLLARDLALSGYGVALLPKGLCSDALKAGYAQTVLPDQVLGRTHLNLLFPSRADMVPRVRAFAEYLSGTLGDNKDNFSDD